MYKKKEFSAALAKYNEAIELDPKNMCFLNNKAAVYFTMKEWDTCIETCQRAVEVGKENFAPFEDRAKALTRCGKAYQKKGDIPKAIETLKESQLEHHKKETERLLKTWELEKKKAGTLAYQDPVKAGEAKQRGNDLFRGQKYGPAVVEYEEAVKRAPKVSYIHREGGEEENDGIYDDTRRALTTLFPSLHTHSHTPQDAPIGNNLAAALCKVMDFNGAKKHVDVALELDPKYIKAWARKGDIHVLMKDNHKALEAYRKGLALDGNNAACKEGAMKVTRMVNMGSQNMTEEEKGRARTAWPTPRSKIYCRTPSLGKYYRISTKTQPPRSRT